MGTFCLLCSLSIYSSLIPLNYSLGIVVIEKLSVANRTLVKFNPIPLK